MAFSALERRVVTPFLDTNTPFFDIRVPYAIALSARRTTAGRSSNSGEKHLGGPWRVDSLSSAFSGDNSITHGNGFAINIEDVIDAVHRRIV
jgi:hypothetical protein